MNGDGDDWLSEGSGRSPRLTWSFSAEAPLVAIQHARETGETLAADAVGSLYMLDRQGKLVGVTRGPSPIRGISLSDTGNGGVALVGDNKLYWFDRQVHFLGHLEFDDGVQTVAVEAHGHYTAVGLNNCMTAIYDSNRKLVRRFGTLQPMIRLEFLVSEPAIVGVAEYGLLCCHTFGGQMVWQEKLWANVGDMAVTGDGQTIFLACYAHGVQCHNENGRQVGSYQVGGTPCRVATSYIPGRIAAATVERHFYYLNPEGQVIWQVELPDDICRILCEPFGKGVICGFQSGRIVRLDWAGRE